MTATKKTGEKVATRPVKTRQRGSASMDPERQREIAQADIKATLLSSEFVDEAAQSHADAEAEMLPQHERILAGHIADPGPPPRYPVPPFGATLLSVGMHIFTTGRQALPPDVVRQHVQAIDVRHEPPHVQMYKAEVLEWIDAAHAYHSKHSPHLLPG